MNLDALSRSELVSLWTELNEADRRRLPIPIPSTERAPDQWRPWLHTLFPSAFLDEAGQPVPFADFHAVFWDYVWGIEPGIAAPAFFAVWPRGGGKSTNTELACAALAARNRRQYGIYVCASQAQADDHVANISSLLETPAFARQYPQSASRKLNQYGASLGWRRNRLRTTSGFTLDALGLDVAGRGRKMGDERPDLLILDDIDDQADSPLIVARKIRALTRKILPAAGPDAIIFGAQNLIHPDSIFSQLLDGRARFLTRRIVSGPHPALRDMRYLETDDAAQPIKLTGGEPTWAGFSLARCQQLIDDEGLDAFLTERQHEVLSAEGLYLHNIWRSSVHAINSFPIPPSWRIDRSFDWGSAKPFAVLWIAQSDGSPANGRTYPAGTLFVIAELYGCDPRRANVGIQQDSMEIARNILKLEDRSDFRGRVLPGPSDAIIYDSRDGQNISQRMALHGVTWIKFSGGPGSRINGAQLVKDKLRASTRGEGPGLYIFAERCPHTIRTLPKLPRDLLHPDDVDCFVAGTEIATPAGPVPIEDLRVGDLVETPIGPRRILKAGGAGTSLTVRVTLSNGRWVEGTPDHKIYSQNVGLLPLCLVSCGQQLVTPEETQWLNSSITETSLFDATQDDATLSAVQQMLAVWGLPYSTAWYGQMPTALFPQGTLCTTETMTPAITCYRIWNWYLAMLMRDTISKRALLPVTISPWLMHAIARVQTDSVLCEILLKKFATLFPSDNLRALIVASLLQHNIRPSGIAQLPVETTRGKWDAKKNNASSVALPFSQRPMPPGKCGPVVTHVAGSSDAKTVYFLTVEQAHLFYANGVLSTNTESEDHIWDALRNRVLLGAQGAAKPRRIQGL